ncbi:MAG: DNA-binding response regulator [Anaerolineae bacterium]|nr:MAG: DNA-binding response regulator [Anaerolineae bacterium]
MTRILIVDDDPMISDSLSYLLQSEGFDVETAATGSEAVQAVERAAFDLVILDIMLPDISGMDVCRHIRSTSTVPVIMLTARDGEMDRVMGLELGADDYLAKPFASRELLARVRAVLRRVDLDRKGSLANVYTVGDVRLDVQARRVFKGDREIDLSAREFDLLTVLMKNAGVAISRDKLIDLVWGNNWIGDLRTLNVHIRWLRLKLEDDPASPKLIQTVRGYGYRMAAPEEFE